MFDVGGRWALDAFLAPGKKGAVQVPDMGQDGFQRYGRSKSKRFGGFCDLTRRFVLPRGLCPSFVLGLEMPGLFPGTCCGWDRSKVNHSPRWVCLTIAGLSL